MWTVQSTKHQQQQQPKPDGENENGNVVAARWWETNGIKMLTKFVWKKGIGDSSAFAVAQHKHTNFFFFLCLWLGPFFFGGFFCFECTARDNASSFSVVEIIVMQLLL